MLGMPISLLSLVDEKRQWNKSRHGTDLEEAPREHSICAHVVQRGEILVIPDALADERFAHSPSVTHYPKVRFYAGAPLRVRGGHCIGALCVIDRQPHDELPQQSLDVLRDLAALAADELELRLAHSTLASELEQRHELENTLRTAYESQSRFVANLHHEIGTPLTSVRLMAELMALEHYGPLSNATYRQYASNIVAITDHITKLANCVLDYKRAESGKVDLEIREIDVVDLVNKTLAIVRPIADEKRISLLGLEHQTSRVSLEGDETKLRQVLLNILSNAVKFTPPNGNVAVYLVRQGDGCISIQVRDTGIGMNSNDIAIALSPFGRVRQRGGSHQAGFGLGLPLAKLLVEAHGGVLDIESRSGEGTVVSAILPCRPMSPHRLNLA